MTGTLLRRSSHVLTQDFSENEVFFCPEESHFYSHCLERLVFSNCGDSHCVVEFGSGDGTPVINSLMRTRFNSIVYGYELNASAYAIAQARVSQCNLDHKYVLHNESFFEADRPEAEYLVANPPYIPAPDNHICMPLLHGGCDGGGITNQLLTLDYSSVMVLISSYSNPVNTIECAQTHGYGVADFMVAPLKFGYYSSEPKVKRCITELRKNRQAFYSDNIYVLAGVLFRKYEGLTADLSNELTQIMTAL